MACVPSGRFLLADAEFRLCDDGAVTVDVLADEIVEQRTALTYQTLECAGGGEVFVVLFQVLGEVFDTDGEQGDLLFGAARVCLLVEVTVLFKDFLFLFF